MQAPPIWQFPQPEVPGGRSPALSNDGSMPACPIAARASSDTPAHAVERSRAAPVVLPGAPSPGDRSAADATAAATAGSKLLIPTVFHERWWLDTVCGGWHAAEVHQGGRLVAWMPYAISRKRGFRVSVLPPLVHLLGPALDEGKGSSNSRWLRRLDVLQELAGRIPRLSLFSQTCHPGIEDILAFQARGFDSSVQFSAEIAPAAPEDRWRGMRDKTRNVIRRAQETLRVEPRGEPEEFARFYAANLAVAGHRSYFDLSLIAPLAQAACARNQGRIVSASDAQGTVASVLYVWDHRRLWYFLSSRRPTAHSSGAVSLLLWEGIRQAAASGLHFDFDGIGSWGSARFYAGFGARTRPRFVLHRRSTAYGLCSTLFDVVRERNRFVVP